MGVDLGYSNGYSYAFGGGPLLSGVESMASTFGVGRVTHRVALELEVEEWPDQVAPEDWDLDQLALALRTGIATAVRTVQGHVVDPEHDRLSTLLEAIVEDVGEDVDLQWLATAVPWPVMARALRSLRPSLEVLVELELLVARARHVAERLRQAGL